MLASRRIRIAAVALVALVTAAGAGIAWATIPGSDGLIHACYKDANGDLRLVSSPGCRASETAIDLGGPTRGYAAGNPGDVALSSPTSTPILTLTLPAGKYLVHAKANLFNLPTSDAVFVPCDLRLDGTTTMLDQDRVVLEAGAGSADASESNVPLQTPVTLTSPGVVVFECAALTRGTSSTVDARYRQLDAVSLDTLG